MTENEDSVCKEGREERIMGIHLRKKPVGKRSMIVRTFILVLIVLGGMGMILWLRPRKDKGKAIKPEHDHPVASIILYGQKNEAWKEDPLGASRYRMGGSGCLTSCIASALSTEKEVWGTGEIITPKELNRLFGENGVYNDQGDIVWGQLKEALPQTQVIVASSVLEEEIENLLDQGHYPVVKVRVGGNGAAHWVLLVGSENGEYVCMDPLSKDGKLIPLSCHGGMVYRMRCVYWEKQG